MRLVDAGRVGYGTAWAWQRDLAARRAAGRVGDVLLLVEHPPVYTAGRNADEANLRFDAAERVRRDIELFRVDRGGDFTYHGPGQLVGYPVVALAERRPADWVRALEEVNLRVLAGLGVQGRRDPDRPGVWVGGDKITAVGVRLLASLVTQHGWATNVTTDLSDFDGIVPCGITGRGVCSLQSLGVDAGLADVRDRTVGAFEQVMRCSLEPVSPDGLDLDRHARPRAPEPARSTS